MRTMIRVSMEVNAANRAIMGGELQRTMEELMKMVQPESAYFTTENGKRTAYVFFQLQDPSQIPKIAEPLFQRLGAEIEFKPVMNREELARGLGSLDSARAA
jgi:hypothetical protein